MATKNKKRIYISSTLDLTVYREGIETTFRKFSKFFEVGRLAEYMMPETRKVLPECLADVNACDIYIIILGFRYGSLEATTGLSFTECEYNCALEGEKEVLATAPERRLDVAILVELAALAHHKPLRLGCEDLNSVRLSSGWDEDGSGASTQMM